MIICKGAENSEGCHYKWCCVSCPDLETCEESCDVIEGQNTEGRVLENCSLAETGHEVIPLEVSCPDLLEHITALSVKKKQIENEEKKMKEELLQAMEQYGIKSWSNDCIKITYVEPTTRKSIDSTRLKKERPDIVDMYTKETSVSASIRITVK